MKAIKRLFATAALIFILGALSAQTPPPPNNGNGNPGGGNTPVGGGAPVGSGLVLMMALGAAYGGKKVYDFKKADAK